MMRWSPERGLHYLPGDWMYEHWQEHMIEHAIRTDRQWSELGRIVADMLKYPDGIAVLSEPRMAELGDGDAMLGGRILRKLNMAIGQAEMENRERASF